MERGEEALKDSVYLQQGQMGQLLIKQCGRSGRAETEESTMSSAKTIWERGSRSKRELIPCQMQAPISDGGLKAVTCGLEWK